MSERSVQEIIEQLQKAVEERNRLLHEIAVLQNRLWEVKAQVRALAESLRISTD